MWVARLAVNYSIVFRMGRESFWDKMEEIIREDSGGFAADLSYLPFILTESLPQWPLSTYIITLLASLGRSMPLLKCQSQLDSEQQGFSVRDLEWLRGLI